MYLLDAFRDWDRSISSVGQYFSDLAVFTWNEYGIVGLLIADMIIMIIGMKSESFGYFFSLLAIGQVRALTMVVGFIATLVQGILVFVGANVAQAAVREYVAEFTSRVDEQADKLNKKKKQADANNE
jgi:hypothetical protein